jgi:hypothetical protein
MLRYSNSIRCEPVHIAPGGRCLAIPPPQSRRPGATGAIPPTHVPHMSPVFFEFLDRRHQPHQDWKWASTAEPVLRQGFNVLATRKPKKPSRKREASQ